MSLPPSPAPAPVPAPRDARKWITEESFRIAPELLGRPLARPWRRLAAVAVDGMLIALLANTPGFLLALAAAIVLFRVSASGKELGFFRRGMRAMLRFSAAVILFVVVVSGWGKVTSGARAVTAGLGLTSAATRSAGTGEDDAVRMGEGTVAFLGAGDEEEAIALAGAMVGQLREEGTGDEEIAALLREIQERDERPWLDSAADSALRTLDLPRVEGAAGAAAAEGEGAPAPDSLVAAYAAALEGGDRASAQLAQERLTELLSAAPVSELRGELREGRRRIAALERDLEEAREPPSLLAVLRRFADDLGLGFGWAGLYFTAFVALWNGRTPGKRLLGLRVIRLDGKPVGWWMAFERFGGYAASIFTGLLGFAQILWDRNRQAIHDKISETVVVREV